MLTLVSLLVIWLTLGQFRIKPVIYAKQFHRFKDERLNVSNVLKHVQLYITH